MRTGKDDVNRQSLSRTADRGTPAIVTDLNVVPGEHVIDVSETYRYSDFSFRNEEKFLVLPSGVKTHIENVLLNWLVERPKTRLCLGNVLGLALTVLAHSAHQIFLDWDAFLMARVDDSVLLRVIRCFSTSVPEPGTYMGEIVAQFFQHCKQQSNLNVKRKLRTDGGDVPVTTQAETKGESPAPTLVNLAQFTSKRSEIDKKFETVMSLKRLPLVTIVFRITRNTPFTLQAGWVEYLEKRVFGTLCYADGTTYLSRFKHDITVHQHGGADSDEVFFSLDVLRNTKYDSVLDRIFESVYLYNRSLDRVKHRAGECNVVYCSDTVYFMDISRRLFVDNSITFVYCYLTNKYMPVIESKEETDAFGLAKILSSVEYSTKCSLKRNHNSRAGHGPLSSVISEGGLNESAKFVNNVMRDYILESRDDLEPADVEEDSLSDYVPQSPNYLPSDYEPKSPNYSPTSSRPAPPSSVAKFEPPAIPLPTLAVAESVKENTLGYAINEPYVNAFLNRPVECGNMY